jgi:hypothetical protein
MKVKFIYDVALAGMNQYDHSTISILDYRYMGSHRFNSLEVIGRITFQRNKGEDRWYGLRYEVSAEINQPQHLDKMHKIAKFIYENRDHSDLQPEEVMALIGRERYFRSHVSTEFLPMSMIGYRFYKVIRETDGEYLTKVIAPSDVLAHKELDKLKKTSLKNSGEVALMFHGIIES